MQQKKNLSCVSSIIDLVGNTPLVELKKVNPNKNVKVYGKLESSNPGGSVKDRAATQMILDAEKEKKIFPGSKLIEPTQGNTGIALAMIATAKGYEIELSMPENATRERVKLMEAYGAKVTLTPSARQMEGAIDYAHEKVSKNQEYFLLNQFANPSNPKVHFETTGPEIWDATAGQITHFVSAMGTTGTIMGVSQYMKQKNRAIKIVGAQPTEGSSIPGIRKWPKEYLPKIFDESRVDEILHVSESQAKNMARRVTREEGILCGISAGGAIHLSVEIAKNISQGVIVCIICDGGDRYLSTDLFD